jgi:hypothetical protein
MLMLMTDGGEHLTTHFLIFRSDCARVRPQRYGGQDIQYTGVDAWPAAQATRKEIERQEKRGEPPVFKRILTAVGVDRASGEVWMALGNNLLHFDKDGNRRATYKIYTPEGARLDASTILVDKDHLLIGSDPLGIYEFDRPENFKNDGIILRVIWTEPVQRCARAGKYVKIPAEIVVQQRVAQKLCSVEKL